MTTADYLESLQDDLATINTSLGLQAGTKFTDIATMCEDGDITVGGGGDLSEYFNTQNTKSGSSSTSNVPAWTSYIKKMPSTIELASNTTSLDYFFRGYDGDVLDLTSFDTRNKTSLFSIFSGSGFKSLILGTNFSISSATDVSYMFEGNRNITSLDLSNLGECPATTTSYMFYNCTSLQSIDMRNFNSTANSVYTPYMFRGDSGLPNLKHIDIRSFVLSTKSVTLSTMFGSSVSWGVPNDCEIIVKDATEKAFFNSNLSRLTNVKTAAEYEAS